MSIYEAFIGNEVQQYFIIVGPLFKSQKLNSEIDLVFGAQRKSVGLRPPLFCEESYLYSFSAITITASQVKGTTNLPLEGNGKEPIPIFVRFEPPSRARFKRVGSGLGLVAERDFYTK